MARGDAFQLQCLDGGVVISDGQTWTAPEGGGARKVQVLVAATLGAYAGNLREGDVYLLGFAIPAGTEIGGITTSIGVVTGTVVIYEIGEAGTVV